MELKWMCEHWYYFFILGLVAILFCVMYSNIKKNEIRNKRWLADEYPEDQHDIEHK